MVTGWAVNLRGPGFNFRPGPWIFLKFYFLLFPAISGHVDRISVWLKVTGSCVSLLYTEYIKEPGCLFEIRAMRIVRRTCLHLISLSSFWWLSLSLALWSDHAVSALVEDAHAPLWLQHIGETM